MKLKELEVGKSDFLIPKGAVMQKRTCIIEANNI